MVPRGVYSFVLGLIEAEEGDYRLVVVMVVFVSSNGTILMMHLLEKRVSHLFVPSGETFSIPSFPFQGYR